MWNGIARRSKGRAKEKEKEEMNVLDELGACQEYLDSAIKWLGDYEVLVELKRRLVDCEKDLAQRIEPVKVLLALTDDQANGSLSFVHGIVGTVPVKVVVVDHRSHCDKRVRSFIVEDLASPTEFVEVVSDEAAVYMQNNEELVNEVSEL
jgi:hypothetical protein